METKIHREQKKKWTLPKFLKFGPGNSEYGFGKTMRAYDVLGYRCPKKGEYYLSGAICEAWMAPNDLSTEFLVVKPTHKVVQRTNWVREDLDE